MPESHYLSAVSWNFSSCNLIAFSGNVVRNAQTLPLRTKNFSLRGRTSIRITIRYYRSEIFAAEKICFIIWNLILRIIIIFYCGINYCILLCFENVLTRATKIKNAIKNSKFHLRKHRSHWPDLEKITQGQIHIFIIFLISYNFCLKCFSISKTISEI
jgi:hypothetical protein